MTPQSELILALGLGMACLGVVTVALSMLGDWLHDRKRKTR